MRPDDERRTGETLTGERPDPTGRRDFLRMAASSMALAGLAACGAPPAEKIVPYVVDPPEIVPGRSRYYATAMPLGGYGKGLLVRSSMGRPLKVEGNPRHPASLGATDPFAQASVLGLYDPDRSQTVTHRGAVSNWRLFAGDMAEQRRLQLLRRGSGLRILTETVTSPTLATQLRALLGEFSMARWHQYEPLGGDEGRRGSILAFGQHVNTVYMADKADVILSLDADFLSTGPGALCYARQWSSRRDWRSGRPRMNRLYTIESTPSVTGSVSDHRLPWRASAIGAVAAALARSIGIPAESSEPQLPSEWIAAVSRDLMNHRGSSLVIAGAWQPAHVHVLAHAMNQALGNVGRTVRYTDPVEEAAVDETRSLRALAADMRLGAVDVLVIIGGNPVYTAPADIDFAAALSKAKLRIHLSQSADETSALCHWNLPETHYLEAWSDIRAFDGTVTIMQPLIAPLFDALSAHELLSILSGAPDRPGYDIVRSYWARQEGWGDFEERWRASLHSGVVEGSALPDRDVEIAIQDLGRLGATPAAAGRTQVEVAFRPDPSIFDGRFANNAWLQESPKPLTKLIWDNAALISPAMAGRLGVQPRDLIEIRSQGMALRAPAWPLPGQPDQTVTLHLGYGRTRAGKVGSGLGFDAYALRTSTSMWHASGDVRKVEGTRDLATTQDRHHLLYPEKAEQAQKRGIVRTGTIEEFRQNPGSAATHGDHHAPAADESLYPGYDYSKGYKWGMAVDLNRCIGCNSCLVACYAENNIPPVGKKQVGMGRELTWMRIDRYYDGDIDNPSVFFQPVFCMHCENAPCEPVCPTHASSHSSEGLNQQVYNRCVGTRYCSNNCPYKVRYFNFLQYADWQTPILKPLRNPEVSVRSRGVMEKCTYCIQRIQQARIEAEKQNRQIRDGEIETACQQACPTRTLVFGDMNDAGSQVTKLKAEPLNYGMLAELNTRPRTTYLARLRNPNPELEKG